MYMDVLIDGQFIEYSIKDGNCHIVDSYFIKEKIYKYHFIKYIIDHHEEFKKRSIKSYYREWKAHNILYKWNIRPASTKDTDLNINEKWYRRLGYFIIASLFTEK